MTSTSPSSAPPSPVSDTDIAIVGMAGRFPGADDVDTFWANLRDGVESIVPFSDEALRARGVPESDLRDPLYVKAGAPMSDVDRFDAAFFGYTPREAEETDPQHRLFLEASWQALEHAGYDAGAWERPIGVYAGCGVNTYLLLHLMPSGRFRDLRDISSLQGLMNGNNKDAMSTTVSYKINLRGPGVTVQTACSTSLAAVHVACRALLNHEADMALAGGVWVNLLQDGGYRHQPGAILSPDGHCRPFDARAAGTVIGNGVGVVVLKRLADALAEGDTVHAVIKGSALNNDGSAKIGYTAPSVAGQAEVIQAAQAMADVPARSVSYVEAHGTGTTLGDPVEVAALTQAFRADTAERGFCGLGSVKSNVGHLDAAAGVTGLIKTVQALRHRVLPPSLHFETPNPQIDFAGSPFYVNAAARDWPAGPTPRRAGVSSFGIGGTNVHVVVEEAPPQAGDAASRGWQLLPLSARTPSALEAAVARLGAHLKTGPAQALADVAHTLQVGRKCFAQRAVALVRSPDDAQAVLGGQQPARLARGTAQAAPAGVAFLFPGQGAQHIDMGRALYDTEPVFRAAFDRCAQGLAEALGLDLRSLVYPVEGADAEAAAGRLAQTSVTQPALFAIEYSLARLWMSWGVRPSAMLGHSIGEYVAACLAGVFALDDALSLVAARGRLLQALPEGAMLAVNLGEASLAPYLGAGCDLAAVNGPERCVLSGPAAAIAAAQADLAAQGVAVQRLHVSHAFHSAMVAPACEALRALVAGVPRHAPSLPFLSNVTGRWITAEEATDPAYWARHLRGTVRFADGLAALVEAEPQRVLLEVGPGEALTQLAQRHPQSAAAVAVSSLPHPRRQASAADHLPMALGRLWLAGVDVDWRALHGTERRLRVPLPTYPFERQSYWVAAPAQGAQGAQAGPVTSTDLRDWTLPLDAWFHAPVWQRLPAQAMAALPPADGLTLVFSEGGAAARALLDRLGAPDGGRAPSVVVVESGTGFKRHAATRYAVHPARREDFEHLFAALRQDNPARVERVFHLWTLKPAQPAADPQDRGLLGLFWLAQALDAAQPGHPVALTVVTSGLEDVTGHEPIDPTQSLLLGPCRVIPQEYPALSCRLVDVEAPTAATPPGWIDALLRDAADAGGPALLAYRGGHRWVPGFEPLALPAPAATPLRPEGVYLVTGGLGGIGLALAGHLARRVRARLVLLGRSAAVEQLRTLGAQVLVLQADVARPAAVEAAIAQARAQFGPVQGVVHAAGDAGGGLVAEQTAERVARVLAPKVEGTRVLMAALAGEPLDFVLLCSSLSTVAGGLSKGAYVAANAYLDGVARAASRRAGPVVVSVNWDSWREVGMAGHMALPPGVGIAPLDGAQAFERILAGPRLAQVLVSTLDLKARLLQAQGDLLSQPLAEGDAPERGANHARPALATPFEAPQDAVQEGIAGIWQTLLGLAEVGIHDNLFELGGDSLLGIQLLSRVRAKYAVELHPAAFFKQPTVAALGVLVETKLIEEIEGADAGQAAG
jgi:phthiocerol/phenolphthiocerol synthesis type-I polyketide synthase E